MIVIYLRNVEGNLVTSHYHWIAICAVRFGTRPLPLNVASRSGYLCTKRWLTPTLRQPGWYPSACRSSLGSELRGRPQVSLGTSKRCLVHLGSMLCEISDEATVANGGGSCILFNRRPPALISRHFSLDKLWSAGESCVVTQSGSIQRHPEFSHCPTKFSGCSCCDRPNLIAVGSG